MDKNKRAQIVEFFKNEPVMAVYLFGSQASNVAGPMSDFDFAILFDESVLEEERLRKRLHYIGFFSKLLTTDHLDVVDLVEGSILLRYEAIKQKGLLYKRSTPIVQHFEKKTISEYLDRLYYIKRHTALGLHKLQKQYGLIT